ncbi:MAG: RHS repeat domain-containing protein [Planctomycetota bacterium]
MRDGGPRLTYGPGIDEPICKIDVADNNAVYYYHFDGLGSVIALSNANKQIIERYSYDVFGEPNRTSDVNNPYLFTGRRYDPEAGLYYYRARYYAYDIGRFLQPDPIGYNDGLNLYAYVGNSPLMLVDPFGLCKGGLSGYERAKIAFLSGVSDAIDWWYKKSGGKEMEKFLWEGRHVGTQYGEQALDYYAQEIAFGEARWYHYLGGTVSSIWQPETWKATTVTLVIGYAVDTTLLDPPPVPPTIPPKPPTKYRHDTPPSRPKYDKKTRRWEPDHWHYQDHDWSPDKRKWFPGNWKYYGPDRPPDAPPGM